MDTNALIILVIEGIIFMYLLYVLATMGSARAGFEYLYDVVKKQYPNIPRSKEFGQSIAEYINQEP
jgi:hypothetical protein